MCVNKLVHHWFMSWLGANTPFTQSLRPLCLPRATIQLTRSPLNAQRRQHGCLDRSKVVHRTFNNRHGRHGRHQVLNMFKTVAEGSARRLVAQRSLKWGRGDAAASPWLQDGCTMVDLWSPSNYMRSTAKLSPSMWATFLPPPASSVPPIACFGWWLWRPLCLHSASMATLEHPCRWFCLLYATSCAYTPCLWLGDSFKGGTKVAGAVTQKQDSLGLGDRWGSWSYFGSLKGGTKVGALYKGALCVAHLIPELVLTYCHLGRWGQISVHFRYKYNNFRAGKRV